MIRRCVEASLSAPQFAVTDGFLTTVHRAALAGHAGAKWVMRGAKLISPGTKRCRQPKTPPCFERATGRPFLVKGCRQPRVLRVGRAISEDGLNGS